MNVTPINQNNQNFGMKFRYKDPNAKTVLKGLIPKFENVDEKLIGYIHDKNGRNLIVKVSTVDGDTVQFEARKQKVYLSRNSSRNTVAVSGKAEVKQLFFPTLETLANMVNKVTPAKRGK